ncbi:MAG: valine--tRNA ligase [Promethearchaeota archaeon]
MAKLKPKIKAKRWSPEIEDEILELWEKESPFAYDRDSNKTFFTVDTPPPYASGTPHMGFGLHYAQIDMVARYSRMKNQEVIFPMGVDRNGLPIEVQTEKEHGIVMRETPRDKFIDLCRQLLDKYENQIIDLAKRLGLSCFSFAKDQVYRTDDPRYRQLTQATFVKLWKNGFVYEAKRPNNWCKTCGTTIADAEIEYIEKSATLSFIRFFVDEKPDYDLIIATTRPELLCACKAILVHPEDERYQTIQNKTAIVPIYETKVPIIPHVEAKMEFGTGAVMICSYGDYTDVRLFRELRLEPVDAISPEGKMTSAAGELEGLTAEEAREKIIEMLKAKELLVKSEPTLHRTPICWRSKDIVEFISMSEYYLKQEEFVPELLELAEQLIWHPVTAKQYWINWLNSVSIDWPVSRRRYYGTELPLYYCNSCGEPIIAETENYIQPWRDPPPFNTCPHCNASEGFRGEDRTFDTWMDSAISPLYITGYLRDPELFQKAFPCGVRPQGKDIIRTWFHYTMLRVYQLTKQPAFKNAWISGMVVDEHGEAMHKSKGNIVNPLPLIEKYGSDAIRMWGSVEASLGSDIRYSTERLEGAFKFITKLWNIARFVSSFPKVEAGDNFTLTPTDKLILSELNKVIKEAKGADEFDFHDTAVKVRSFVWNILADHFIELLKSRCYNRDRNFSEEEMRGAWFTLHTVLKTVLKLLAPIIPFVTEKIWREIYSSETSIHTQLYPTESSEWEVEFGFLSEPLFALNSTIWKFKKDEKQSLRAPIPELWISKEFELFKNDLQYMHSVETLRFGSPALVDQFESLELDTANLSSKKLWISKL